jgi:6-phosphogluconolactonase
MAARAQIEVLSDPGEAAAERLVHCAGRGGQIALTGGSTPAAAYRRAAAAEIDWSGATLWFGDERCVPPGDERSNYGMAREALLEAISGPAPAVQRIEGERGPHDGADDYERRLHEVFGAGMPELDLVLLGLGPDGHCASLFPGQPSLDEADRVVVGVEEAGLEPFVPRVSFTLPIINAARHVVFLVAGEGKAEAVARAFAAEPGPHTPASLVAPAAGELVVLLDAAAASRLPEGATR